MPKLKPLAVVGLISLVGICCLLLWGSAKPQPTPFPLAVPASAKLLHSFRHVGGVNEKTYAFAFEVTDQSLMDQLTSEWSLRDCSTDHFPGSFASMTAAYWEISWWPDRTALEAIPVRYGFTDNTKQTYRTLYFDDVSGRLYVEYGNW